MFNKMWRYLIAKTLINSAMYREGLRFGDFSNDVDVMYNTIMEDNKIHNTKTYRAIQCKEAHNG